MRRELHGNVVGKKSGSECDVLVSTLRDVQIHFLRGVNQIFFMQYHLIYSVYPFAIYIVRWAQNKGTQKLNTSEGKCMMET